MIASASFVKAFPCFKGFMICSLAFLGTTIYGSVMMIMMIMIKIKMNMMNKYDDGDDDDDDDDVADDDDDVPRVCLPFLWLSRAGSPGCI